MNATMTIEDTFTIKGRGLVLAGHPSAEPAVGMVARLPDGRAWTVRGVERQGMKRWHPGDASAMLIGDAGAAPPQIGDVVELVGESPAASTEPEGPRVVAGVTVYLDGKRLAENVEVTITEGVNLDALADLFERGTVKPCPMPVGPQVFTVGCVTPEHPDVIHARIDHVVPPIDGEPTS